MTSSLMRLWHKTATLDVVTNTCVLSAVSNKLLRQPAAITLAALHVTDKKNQCSASFLPDRIDGEIVSFGKQVITLKQLWNGPLHLRHVCQLNWESTLQQEESTLQQEEL